MGHHVLSSTLLGWMILYEERDLSLIKLVISKTKDLNKLDKSGDSYLMRAAMTRKFKDVVISLIEAGCDMYIKDREGKNFYDLAYDYVKKEIKKNYPEFIHCKDMTDQQSKES
jgi:ankyrin repeat protein